MPRKPGKPEHKAVKQADITTAFRVMHREALQQLLYGAITSCRGRGRKAVALKLSDGLLLDICSQVLIDSEPAATTVRKYKRQLAEVGASQNSMLLLLEKIREHYSSAVAGQTARASSAVEIYASKDDMMGLSKWLIAMLTNDVIQMLRRGDGFAGMQASVRHATLRLVEAAIDAAKIDADQAYKRLQTEQLQLKLEALVKDARQSGQPIELRKLSEIFDSFMRGGAAAGSVSELKARLEEAA